MKNICYDCHLKTVNNLIKKFEPSSHIVSELNLEIKHLLKSKTGSSNPEIATYIHRLIKEKLRVGDLYHTEKIHANSVLLSSYDNWKSYIHNCENPFYEAVKLAIAGNIVDYAAHSVPEDIELKIHDLIKQPLALDYVANLQADVMKAKSILYLGDNAGEIVFDKLLLETMGHSNVTYVVRGKAIINDVTFEDAGQTSIDQLCNVISNGYDAPSTILEYCSKEFLDAFDNADLIIAKGQGNFEGLMDVKKSNIYFLLTVKCSPIAEILGLHIGDLVVKRSKKIANPVNEFV